MMNQKDIEKIDKVSLYSLDYYDYYISYIRTWYYVDNNMNKEKLRKCMFDIADIHSYLKYEMKHNRITTCNIPDYLKYDYTTLWPIAFGMFWMCMNHGEEYEYFDTNYLESLWFDFIKAVLKTYQNEYILSFNTEYIDCGLYEVYRINITMYEDGYVNEWYYDKPVETIYTRPIEFPFVDISTILEAVDKESMTFDFDKYIKLRENKKNEKGISKKWFDDFCDDIINDWDDKDMGFSKKDTAIYIWDFLKFPGVSDEEDMAELVSYIFNDLENFFANNNCPIIRDPDDDV